MDTQLHNNWYSGFRNQMKSLNKDFDYFSGQQMHLTLFSPWEGQGNPTQRFKSRWSLSLPYLLQQHRVRFR